MSVLILAIIIRAYLELKSHYVQALWQHLLPLMVEDSLTSEPPGCSGSLVDRLPLTHPAISMCHFRVIFLDVGYHFINFYYRIGSA